MNTLRNKAQRVEDEISNVGAPPRGEQVPPFEDYANVDQASDNPPPLTVGDIRTSLT